MVDYHYWQWNLSHTQVYRSDTESNVTLKVTRVGRFSSYVTVASAVIKRCVALRPLRAHLYASGGWVRLFKQKYFYYNKDKGRSTATSQENAIPILLGQNFQEMCSVL